MKTTFCTIIGLSLLMACGEAKTNDETKTTEAVAEVPTEEVKNKTDELVAAYMELKEALVATNSMAAQKAAQNIADVEGEVVSIKAIAKAITESDDIEMQREKFSELTAEFVSYIKENGAGDKLFVQFCPMAFNNTGGTWVSLSEEINNPYFGDKMLKCGRVEEEI